MSPVLRVNSTHVSRVRLQRNLEVSENSGYSWKDRVFSCCRSTEQLRAQHRGAPRAAPPVLPALSELLSMEITNLHSPHKNTFRSSTWTFFLNVPWIKYTSPKTLSAEVSSVITHSNSSALTCSHSAFYALATTPDDAVSAAFALC